MDRELADKIWAYRERRGRAARARMNIREKFKETGLEELKEEIEVLKQALRECNEKLKGRAGKWN
jgi:hypothetical protein